MHRNPLTANACLLICILVGCGQRYTYVTYQDTIFNGPTATNINRMFPRDPNIIPKLFVRTPQGEVFLLEQLPQEVVGKLPGVQHVRNAPWDSYELGDTSLEYKDGKLGGALSFGEGPLEIGAKQQGPFHRLPMTQVELQNLFGEPERDGRASKPLFRWF